jgi:hypothetical protein
MKDTASILFGETPRVRLVRLFATHAERPFSVSEISAQTKLSRAMIKREVEQLVRVKVITQRKDAKKVTFQFVGGQYNALTDLLFTESKAATDEKRVERLAKAGKLRFVGVGGVLVNDQYGGIEMVIVGDLKEKLLARAIKKIEEDLNKEIRFMVLTEKEFGNRLDVRDRLVYGLFERPHEIWFSKTKVPLPRLHYHNSH